MKHLPLAALAVALVAAWPAAAQVAWSVTASYSPASPTPSQTVERQVTITLDVGSDPVTCTDLARDFRGAAEYESGHEYSISFDGWRTNLRTACEASDADNTLQAGDSFTFTLATLTPPGAGASETAQRLTVTVVPPGKSAQVSSDTFTPVPVAAGSLTTMVKLTEDGGSAETDAPITFGLPMDPGGSVSSFTVAGEPAQVDGCTTDRAGNTRWCRITAKVDLTASQAAIATVASTDTAPADTWTLAADNLPANSLPRMIVTDVNGDGATWTCDLASTQTATVGGAFDYNAAHNPGWTWGDGHILKAGANWSVPCLRSGDNAVHPDLRLHADVYAYSRDAATVDYIEVDLRLENSFWQDTDGWWRDTMTDVYAGIEIENGSGASLYSAPSITSSADLTVTDLGDFAKHWLSPLVTITTTGSPFTFDHQGSMLVSGTEHYTIVDYVDANTVTAMAHDTVTSGTITTDWTVSGVRIPHSSRAVKTVVSYGTKPSIKVRHHRDNLFAGGLMPPPSHESAWVAPRNADHVTRTNLSNNNNLLPLAMTEVGGSTNCVIAGWWPYAEDRGTCGNPEGHYLPLQHVEGLREVDADGFHPATDDWETLIFRTSRLHAASGKRTFRSKTTGKIIDFLNDSQVQDYQSGFANPVKTEFGPQPIYDIAHANSQSYVPCLITGRFWDCEDVQAQIAYYHQRNLNQNTRLAGSQGAKLMWENCGQLRNCAWWDRFRLYATIIADDGTALSYSKNDLRTYIADDHAYGKSYLIDGGWTDQPEPHGPTNYFWLKGGENPVRKAWQSIGYGSAIWYAHKLSGELTADGEAIANRYTATEVGLLTEPDVCPDDLTCWQRWGSGNLWEGFTFASIDNSWAGVAAEIDRQGIDADWNRCYELGGLSALRAAGFEGIVSTDTAWDTALRIGSNPPDGGTAKLVTLDGSGNPNAADMDNWYGTCRWFYVTEKPAYTAPPAPPSSTVLEQVANGTGAGWDGSGAMTTNETRRVGGATPVTFEGQGVLASQANWGVEATYDDVNTYDPASGLIDTYAEGICETIYLNLSSADKADWDAGTKFLGQYKTCGGLNGYATGQAYLIESWVGWAWDSANNRAYFIGGGHNNGGDSSVYSVNFNATDVADLFQRETEPTASPTIGDDNPDTNEQVCDPGETGLTWSGNSAPSIHSYDSLVWMPTVGKMKVSGGSGFCGNSRGLGDHYFLWTPGSKGVGDQGYEAYTDNITIDRGSYHATAWVPGLDVTLHKKGNDGYVYDPATNTYSARDSMPAAIGAVLECAPASAFPISNQPLCISIDGTPVSQGGKGLSVYSFDTSTTPPTPQHNYCIEDMPMDAELRWAEGAIAWDGDAEEFVFWNGNSKMASLPASAIDGCHNTGVTYQHTGVASADLFTMHTLTGDYVPSHTNCISSTEKVYSKFRYAGDGLLVGMNCAADGAWVFKR